MSDERTTGAASTLSGIAVVESTALPLIPSPGTWARRYVRHGMADVLAWLGEDVGPKPDDQTHALMIGGTLHASAAMVGRLRDYTPARPAPESAGEEQA